MNPVFISALKEKIDETEANIKAQMNKVSNTIELFAYWCRLLIIFANNLYPDQARQNVGPDLDPNCLTL